MQDYSTPHVDINNGHSGFAEILNLAPMNLPTAEDFSTAISVTKVLEARFPPPPFPFSVLISALSNRAETRDMWCVIITAQDVLLLWAKILTPLFYMSIRKIILTSLWIWASMSPDTRIILGTLLLFLIVIWQVQRSRVVQKAVQFLQARWRIVVNKYNRFETRLECKE